MFKSFWLIAVAIWTVHLPYSSSAVAEDCTSALRNVTRYEPDFSKLSPEVAVLFTRRTLTPIYADISVRYHPPAGLIESEELLSQITLWKITQLSLDPGVAWIALRL